MSNVLRVPPKLIQGMPYGEWTIIDAIPFRKEGRDTKRFVKAQCSCGNIRDVLEAAISEGTSTKCRECKDRAHGALLVKETTGWNTHLYRYKQNANNRNLEWNLTEEQFRDLCSMRCYYCGDAPTERKFSSSAIVVANGIDRKDSTKGYEESNCLPCCGTCNIMKKQMSVDEFIAHVHKIGTNKR